MKGTLERSSYALREPVRRAKKVNSKFSWILSGSLAIVLSASGCGINFGGSSLDIAKPSKTDNSASGKGFVKDGGSIKGFLQDPDEATKLTDDTKEKDKPGSCRDIKDLNECTEACTAQNGKCVRRTDGCSNKAASGCKNSTTPWGGTCHLDSKFGSLCYEQKPAGCGQVPQAACNGACEWNGGTNTCDAKADHCSGKSADACGVGNRCNLDKRFASGGLCYGAPYQNCGDITDATACNDSCEWDGAACTRKADATCSGKTVADCGTAAPIERCKLDERFVAAQCYQGKYTRCEDITEADKCHTSCAWHAGAGTCGRKADRCNTVPDNQCDAYACRADNRFENGAKCYHDQALWDQKKQEAFAELQREIKRAKAAPGSSAYNEFHAKRAAFALYEIARSQPQHGNRINGVGCSNWGSNSRGTWYEPRAPSSGDTQKWREWLADTKLTQGGRTILDDLRNTVTIAQYNEEEVIRWLYEIHSRQQAMAGVALDENGIGAEIGGASEREVNRGDKIYEIGLAQKSLRHHFYEQENFIADSSKAGSLMQKTAYYFIKWVRGAANPQAYKDPEQFARNNHDDSVLTKVVGTIQDLDANAWKFYDRMTGTQRSHETVVLALNLLIDDDLIDTRGVIFNANQKFNHKLESLQGLLMAVQTKQEIGGCSYGQLGLGVIRPLEGRTTLIRGLNASKFFDDFRLPAFVKAYVELNLMEKASLKASADKVVENLADPGNTYDPVRYRLVGIDDIPNQVVYAPYKRLLTLFKRKWMQDYDALLALNPEDAIYSRDAAEHWCDKKIKRLYMLFNYPKVEQDIVKAIKHGLNQAGGTSDEVDYLAKIDFRAAALSDNALKQALLTDEEDLTKYERGVDGHETAVTFKLRDKIPLNER